MLPGGDVWSVSTCRVFRLRSGPCRVVRSTVLSSSPPHDAATTAKTIENRRVACDGAAELDDAASHMDGSPWGGWAGTFPPLGVTDVTSRHVVDRHRGVTSFAPIGAEHPTTVGAMVTRSCCRSSSPLSGRRRHRPRRPRSRRDVRLGQGRRQGGLRGGDRRWSPTSSGDCSRPSRHGAARRAAGDGRRAARTARSGRC